MILRPPSRPGALAVEAAVVYSLTMLLLFGLFVGGLGVFRYQEVAYLAQEGARYAAVRGQDYEYEVPGAKAATKEDIYRNAIRPRIVGLDENRLTYDVRWDSSNAPLTPTANFEKGIRNTVSVNVNYEWIPELIFVGPFTFSSTATVPMSY